MIMKLADMATRGLCQVNVKKGVIMYFEETNA